MQPIPPLASNDHLQGDFHAPLQLVHYGDFECPYSRAATETIAAVRGQLGTRLVHVFRPFPLADIHPHALQAAEAGEIAAAQGHFWALYELMFDHQENLDLPSLRAYFHEMRLDVARFDAEMEAHTHRPAIQKHIEAARAAGAHGTPTIFVNGVFHDNHERLWQASRLLHVLDEATSAR